MKILNLYAGIGGNRKLWGDEHDITAVEYDQATADVYKSYFPDDTVIVADAHEYLLQHYKEYDFIWSSPPCPTHSDVRRCGVHGGIHDPLYPDMTLYQQIIFLRHFMPKGKLYCVENVTPYYYPLIEPDKKLHRHCYWCNFRIDLFEVKDNRKHDDIRGNSTVYGFNLKDTVIKDKRRALRNMVDPELGKHVLDCALNQKPSPAEQGRLF